MALVRVNTFKDFNKKFTVDKYDDVTVKVDTEAIKGAVENILMIAPFEVPMRIGPAVGIPSMLFKPMSRQTIFNLRNVITSEISKYEPRFRVTYLEVNKDHDDSSIEIVITGLPVGAAREVTFRYFLEKVR